MNFSAPVVLFQRLNLPQALFKTRYCRLPAFMPKPRVLHFLAALGNGACRQWGIKRALTCPLGRFATSYGCGLGFHDQGLHITRLHTIPERSRDAVIKINACKCWAALYLIHEPPHQCIPEDRVFNATPFCA